MEEIRLKLTEAIFEVFEKMLFVFLEPTDESGTNFEMVASIHYYDDADMKGDCRLSVSRELAATMAQNLIGFNEQDITAKCAEDCVKETVNMICGNFLSKFDNSRVFHLSIPELADYLSEEAVDKEGLYRLDFNSDYGKIGVFMKMSGQ